MKTKSSKFTVLQLKVLLIITSTIFGFAGITNCLAQSVVGKWKITDTNRFTIDEATGKQTTGSDEVKKQFDEHMASEGFKEIPRWRRSPDL